MVAHTAKRLESVRLFSSDRVCLKSAQPLCLIESAQKELSHALFHSSKCRTCMATLIKYTCQESIQSFILNAHAKKAHIYTYLIEYTC